MVLVTLDFVSIQNTHWFCLRTLCLHQVQRGWRPPRCWSPQSGAAFGQIANNLESEVVSNLTPVRWLIAASETGLNNVSLWTFMSCVHQVLIMAGSVPERLIKFIVWLHGTVMGV